MFDDLDITYGTTLEICNSGKASTRKRCTEGQKYKSALHRQLRENFQGYNNYILSTLRENGNLCSN